MECAICLDTINDEFKLLHCNHYFHQECIDIWLKNHNTCPYCRTMVKYIIVKVKRKTYKLYINKTNLVFEKNNVINQIEFSNIKTIKYNGKKKITIIKKELNNTLSKLKLFSKNGYYIFNSIKNHTLGN